jgi:hypothetical protein
MNRTTASCLMALCALLPQVVAAQDYFNLKAREAETVVEMAEMGRRLTVEDRRTLDFVVGLIDGARNATVRFLSYERDFDKMDKCVQTVVGSTRREVIKLATGFAAEQDSVSDAIGSLFANAGLICSKLTSN